MNILLYRSFCTIQLPLNMCIHFTIFKNSFLKKYCYSIATILEPDVRIDEFDDYYYNYSPDDLDLTISEDEKIRIKEIILEMDVYLRFKYGMMPKNVSLENWKEIMNAENCNIRKRFYKALYLKERTREIVKRVADEKYATFPQFANAIDTIPNKNRYNFFINISRNMCMKWNYFRVAKAQLMGPHLIFDCGYDTLMDQKEIAECAHHIINVHSANRIRHEPFNIIHCNTDKSSPLISAVRVRCPDFFKRDKIFNITEKNFVDLFPDARLIYLSPHTHEEMETYDTNAIYIIGALVDLRSKNDASSERAQQFGVKSVKFPLDRYLNWCQGTTSLSAEWVVRILMDLRDGIPWERALMRVPRMRTTFSVWNKV